MGATRRKFTLEFKTEAPHRVINTGRTVRDVAKELSVLENSLSVGKRRASADGSTRGQQQ